MKAPVMLLLGLVGCGNPHIAQPASETRASMEAQKRAIWARRSFAEQEYFACVQAMGRRFGSRQQVTATQAQVAADQCRHLLKSAATAQLGRADEIERIDRQLDASRPRSQEEITAHTVMFVEHWLENDAMRQISAAVSPPPLM